MAEPRRRAASLRRPSQHCVGTAAMLALPLLLLPLQNLGDTYHYGGDYGAAADYRLVKTNAECATGDLKLGEFATVAECAAAREGGTQS